LQETLSRALLPVQVAPLDEVPLVVTQSLTSNAASVGLLLGADEPV